MPAWCSAVLTASAEQASLHAALAERRLGAAGSVWRSRADHGRAAEKLYEFR